LLHGYLRPEVLLSVLAVRLPDRPPVGAYDAAVVAREGWRSVIERL
jgi:hypothetical protein